MPGCCLLPLLLSFLLGRAKETILFIVCLIVALTEASFSFVSSKLDFLLHFESIMHISGARCIIQNKIAVGAKEQPAGVIKCCHLSLGCT